MTPTIGSHALLLQMTTNLVHNAIVHNLPEHGAVWVTTAFGSEGVVLTVENTGEQLTPQLVSTLAEPFRRGTERIRTDHAGVGLGLAIVKSITEAHDGTLTLDRPGRRRAWRHGPTTGRATASTAGCRGKQKAPHCGAFVARPERFELPTFGSVDRRSIQLSYGRMRADCPANNEPS